MKPPLYWEKFAEKTILDKRVRTFKRFEKKRGRAAAQKAIDRTADDAAKSAPENPDMRERYRAYFYYRMGWITADEDVPPREET